MQSTNKKRLLVWGVAGVAGLSILALAVAPQPVPVDTETLATGPLRVTLDHEGRTRVREPFVVSSPVAGRVRRIALEPGDRVTKGETILAAIEPEDPDPLDPRDRAEASAAAAAAEARLAVARAEVARAAARLQLTRDDRDRAARLAREEIVASRDLQAAETEALAAAEALEVARAGQRAASFELQRARARLATPERARQLSASAAIEILAPIDGVVLRRLRQSASTVPKGEPLLEIGDPDGIEIVADYLSTDAARIRPGMPAVVTRWGGAGDLEGRVRRVDPAGFTKISALGVEEQRVNVIVDLVAPRSAWSSLGESYRVEVGIVVWESDDVLTVPASSLYRHEGAWAVFAVEDSRAQLSRVDVGQSDGRRSEVSSGLEPGDVVVTHPPESLEDGARVEKR